MGDGADNNAVHQRFQWRGVGTADFDLTLVLVEALKGAAAVLVQWLKNRRPGKGEKCFRRRDLAPKTRNRP